LPADRLSEEERKREAELFRATRILEAKRIRAADLLAGNARISRLTGIIELDRSPERLDIAGSSGEEL